MNALRHPSSILRLLGSVLCLPLLLPSASAQPSAEEIVSVQFRIMAWQGDIPALAYGERQTVESVENNDRSLVHTYVGPSQLVFFLKTSVPAADPRKPPPPAASVTFPLDAKKVTLLTVPTGKGRLGMYPIREDESLPARHIRVHNLSSENLLLGVGSGAPVELAPASSTVATASGPGLVVRVAKSAGGRWRELFNNVVPLADDAGVNVLLMNGQQGAGIGMFTVPAWPAKPASPQDPSSP